MVDAGRRSQDGRRSSRLGPRRSRATTLIEHPELVAERIRRFANIVGRERVIASCSASPSIPPRASPGSLRGC